MNAAGNSGPIGRRGSAHAKLLRIVNDSTQKLRPYQLSVRTTRDAGTVLSELANRRIQGINVSEAGPNHIILHVGRKNRYTPLQAVFLAAILTLAVFVVSAYIVPVVALVAVTLVGPFLPLLRQALPIVAVSGVPEGNDITRITAHGEVSPELAASLDAYFATLPQLEETIR